MNPSLIPTRIERKERVHPMSAGTITITAGRREREGNEQDYSGPDGTRSAMLVRVSEPITATSTMGTSKDGTWTYRDWTFAIDDGSEYDGQVLDARASVKASEKSKQFEIISALFGRKPPVGTTIDIEKHLIGRSCLIAIGTNDNNFPVIESFLAAPSSGKPAAKAETKPVAPADDASLPF